MKKSNSRVRLHELMDYFKLNQTELCKCTGLQKSALSNYLNGDREPRQDQISLIADPFNINPAWLMGYDVPMFLQYTDECEAGTNMQAPGLSSLEKDIINAYRKASADTQIAVCAVLGVKKGTESVRDESIAE